MAVFVEGGWDDVILIVEMFGMPQRLQRKIQFKLDSVSLSDLSWAKKLLQTCIFLLKYKTPMGFWNRSIEK